MTFAINGSILKIVRERDDKRFRSESDVWYRLRQSMRQMGYDVMKRNPEKDGHLHSAPYYLRERKWRFAVWDSSYAIRDLAKDMNEYGIVRLSFERWEKEEVSR